MFWDCFGVCLKPLSLNSVTHTHSDQRGKSKDVPGQLRGNSEDVPDHQFLCKKYGSNHEYHWVYYSKDTVRVCKISSFGPSVPIFHAYLLFSSLTLELLWDLLVPETMCKHRKSISKNLMVLCHTSPHLEIS